MRFFLPISGLLSLVCVAATDGEDRTHPFAKTLEPFLSQHCYECHDDLTAEGGLDLFALSPDLSDEAAFAKWERIYDRVAKGEMPPEKQPRPDAGELSAFRRTLAPSLAEAHEATRGTVLRRLNRREYANTMNDIFGTNLDLARLLPEDGLSHGFDTVGDALGLSMVHMEKYLEAAELVLETAIERTLEKPEPVTKTRSFLETRDANRHLGKLWGKTPEGDAVLFFKRYSYPRGVLHEASAGADGYYRIRITGYAYRSEEPVTFEIAAYTHQRGFDNPVLGYRSFAPGEPQTVELTAWIEDRYMVQVNPWGISDENNAIRQNGVENYEGPGLAIQSVELIGPIVEDFPAKGHELVFGGLDRRPAERFNPKNPVFELHLSDPPGDVAPVLRRIAWKAFRRPVSEEDIRPYLALFESELAGNSTPEEALRAAVTAIFCSPDFLYFREDPGLLDDHALATRLAYFLTRTAPDDLLLEAAGRGELTKGTGSLTAHARRLIDGPLFDRFVTDFTDGWLNLRDIEFTAPDSQLYPEFDPFLQWAMLEESRSFFRELVRSNLSAGNIVRSDFAMLNNRLAEHYGIPGVDGPEIRKVSLPANSIRGGVLTQGSVLKVSANGTNTSPILRGIWVLERIYGEEPPPPPAGIPGVEPDIRGASTIRELLAKHREMVRCQSCHELIDPPGFALESFNPIGGWRENYRSLGTGEKVDASVNGIRVRYRAGPPVDPSGQLPDGTPFADFRAFRDLLAEQEDTIAKTVAKSLLTFATGREMGFSDRPEINRIVAASAGEGHGMRDLIERVVASDIFLRK